MASTSVREIPSGSRGTAASVRNYAVDAYRGFVMLLMMAEVLHLARVARAVPDNWLLGFLAWNQTHVEWAGASLHDLIQPSFSFLVGVALPYSLASRRARGATTGRMLLHAVWRSLLLIGLGLALRQRWTFEDTLAQIGLGYTFLFLLGLTRPRWHWIALAAILAGYWAAWALYPIAPGLPFEAHWAKNANLGHAFDVWFLNLFPRSTPFVENRGGYLTLSFIPTLGTMILGLIAGRWLRESAPSVPYRRLCLAGLGFVAAGIALHYAGVCPVVKRIWTPTWTLASGGACFLLLAAFNRMKPWFPLVVIGMNSIAAYLIAHLPVPAPFGTALKGWAYEPLLSGGVLLVLYWLILYVMYRRGIFLRI
jgi:heparan-alpha-glucosaminide N-acetyltransferase